MIINMDRRAGMATLPANSVAIDKAIDRQRHGRDEVLEVTGWIANARDAAGLLVWPGFELSADYAEIARARILDAKRIAEEISK